VNDAWVLELAASPWLLPALFALVVGDAFLVILPSETAVVALGALAGATGSPSPLAFVPVAAVGAILGDSLCYLIGRRVGIDRWGWQRRGRVGAALARVRGVVLSRPAVLIFTARYIPYARIAVNLSAGAARLPYGRFLPLSAAAGLGWALYNTGVGMAFGVVLREHPILAIVLSVVVAIALGIAVDYALTRISRARQRRAVASGTAPAEAQVNE
jgi:membrane protein DedA with SNARE-associated domain